MLVPKIPVDVKTFASISVAQYAIIIVSTALTLILLLTIPIDPEAELLCPAISIDPHSCRPIVDPIIAYSIGYYPGYKKELNGSQTGRSKTLCRLELRIERTHK